MSLDLPGPVIPGDTKDSAIGSFVIYLKDYFSNLRARTFLFTIGLLAILIFFNYTTGIESRFRAFKPWPLSLLAFFLFYTFIYLTTWGIQSPHPRGSSRSAPPWALLLLAPLFFSFKIVHWDLSFLIPASWHYPWGRFTLIILQLPAKLLALVLLLAVCRKWLLQPPPIPQSIGQIPGDNNFFGGDNNFFGLSRKNFSARPYLLILICLIPVIALASTQHDFLATYPKVKSIAFIDGYTHPVWPWKLLYELSYGLDFVSIELFFRGFLVIGLARWAGKDAILPMAAFYCTIHFGKPLGECITSFFGGLALGVIAWRTRSILGGLIVHLGIAWLMETGGWLGNLFHL